MIDKEKKYYKNGCCYIIFPTFETQSLINNFNLNMEGYEKNDGMEMNDRDEIYSKPVRAGKRTYFFDVKATRNNDYYLTITESKKKLEKDGSQNYEKHKIFLYKEDFDKFAEGLDNAVAYIKAALNGETMAVQKEVETNKFDDIDFDDLSK
ncbi:MAG: DUF3276 family protein [Butyricimonas virosa]|nr:DUF3276 family protein [Butyricimonas virosa]